MKKFRQTALDLAPSHGSAFTGIGGFDLGFEQAGFKTAWQIDNDPYCQRVQHRHWPDVRRYRDVTQIKDRLATVDVISGGFPCQDVSVAGSRKGLAGDRSGLFFSFADLIERNRPRWIVIENVPGLLSSQEGRDFDTVLSKMVGLGYRLAWRVLDAQYYGLAQRRRRVYIVGSLGNGRSAQVLFESEGMSWSAPEIRGKGAVDPTDTGGGSQICSPVAGTLDQKSARSDRGQQQNEMDFVVASPLMERSYKGQFGDPKNENLIAYNIQTNDGGNHKRQDRPNGGMYVTETDTSLTVGTTDLTAIVWHNKQSAGEIRVQGDTSPTISKTWGTGGNNTLMVGVRRLTPTECSRLQGFPDDWNDWLSDATRYRQFGNAVAVPVARWIGKRIIQADRLVIGHR